MPKYTAKLNIELEIDADNEEQALIAPKNILMIII